MSTVADSSRLARRRSIVAVSALVAALGVAACSANPAGPGDVETQATAGKGNTGSTPLDPDSTTVTATCDHTQGWAC